MRIVWYKRAYERFLQVSVWYAENMGQQAASKFEKDILALVELLSKQPGIGMLDERRSTEERKYYSFLSHPLYRIVYSYTEDAFYVVAIRSTRMVNERGLKQSHEHPFETV